METVIILSVMGILLVICWYVGNAAHSYWMQRELLDLVPQQGEADTADNANADTIADNTNADTANADTINADIIHDIWPF